VKDGGGTFRARFGVEREEKAPDGSTVKVNLLAEGSYSLGSEIKDGYPEFTYGVLKKLGWDKDLTDAEKAVIERIGGKHPRYRLMGDRPLRWHPAGGHGARHHPLRQRQGPCQRMEPAPIQFPYTVSRSTRRGREPRCQVSDAADARQFRMPNNGFTIQKAAVDRGIAKNFPIILTSGRLVNTRAAARKRAPTSGSPSCSRTCSSRSNPADAAERASRIGAWVLVSGPEMVIGKVTRMKALVTERVGKGVAWMPFHFAGWFQGVDQRSKYPQGNRSDRCSARA